MGTNILKLCRVLSCAFITICAAGFRPSRISYLDLIHVENFKESRSNQKMADALGSVGIVSITGIPPSRLQKQDVLAWSLHQCASSFAKTAEHVFSDGTRRLTLATHTIAGPGGAQNIFPEGTPSSEACLALATKSDSFRATVAEVTHAFALRLTALLGSSIAQPLLSTTAGSYHFQTFKDVVETGNHLEHFHSYQRTVTPNHSVTIDLHTDQGLFIVFSPGRVVSQTTNKISGGFYIQLSDGSLTEVELDNDDDLIIMLGDGVNQYINPKIKDTAQNLRLRAVPHALVMPDHDDEEVRVWYGRMVLPPDAAFNEATMLTFGEMRRRAIEGVSSLINTQNNDRISLGCSSSLATRQLETSSCAANALMCWMRCMDLSLYNVSQKICSSQKLKLACVNPRNQLWPGNTHGDYYPACSNTTQPATDFPTLPTYPRNDSKCTKIEWNIFASSSGYFGFYELLKDTAYLYWNVLDGGSIQGKIVFNGLFGYLGFGFANPKSAMRMLGGSIIMALPGNNYSAVTGLDLTQGPTVNEYKIAMETAFRHWSKPLPKSPNSIYNIQSTKCFMAMTFKAKSINGIPFNVSGTDQMMWAANSVDSFAGYHGQNRSVFFIKWLQPNGGANIKQYEKAATSNGYTIKGNMAFFVIFLYFVSYIFI